MRSKGFGTLRNVPKLLFLLQDWAHNVSGFGKGKIAMKLCTSFGTRLGSQGRFILKMVNTGTPQLITFKLLSFSSVLRPDVYDNFYVKCTAVIVLFLKNPAAEITLNMLFKIQLLVFT